MQPQNQFAEVHIPYLFQPLLEAAKQLKIDAYTYSTRFKCSKCAHRARDKFCLRKHMSKHTGIYPYVCVPCNYRTPHSSNFIRHGKSTLHLRNIQQECNFD